MTAQNQAILDNLSAAVTAAATALNNQKSVYNTVLAEVRELQRQAEVHRASGAYNDLQIVNSQLTAKYAVLATEETKLKDAQKSYDSAIAAYQSASSSLLSPEERQAELVKAQSAATQATSAAKTAETIAATNYASTRTKYYIIAGVVLVVVVVVVWYFGFRKKKGA